MAYLISIADNPARLPAPLDFPAEGLLIQVIENDCSKVCPLCGKPNGCGLASHSTPCWCSSVTISESILKTIPLEARNVVCICKACAERAERG